MKNIEEYIQVTESVLSEDLCDRIIKEFSDQNEWTSALVASGLHKEVRNCDTIAISHPDIIVKNPTVRKKIDNDIFTSITKLFDNLHSKHSYLNIENDSGYDLLKYSEGGFYLQHIDDYKTNPRVISCSLCLNDDYEGGEFAFFDKKLILKPKKGSALLFPSNFMFPHEIMPIIAGTRYSIVTWFN